MNIIRYNRGVLHTPLISDIMEVNCSQVSDGEKEVIITLTAKQMGYSTLKEKQKQAILSFVNGRYVFVVLPTGFGKSLCHKAQVFGRLIIT